jgi:peroxin-2
VPASLNNYGAAMTSANFAAAQRRVLERRRLLEAETRTRLADQQRASRVNHATLERLPYPLNRLSGSGLHVWNQIQGREGTRPQFRVGQVDAELLDEELLGLLNGQVGEALKYFGVCAELSKDLSRCLMISNFFFKMLVSYS